MRIPILLLVCLIVVVVVSGCTNSPISPANLPLSTEKEIDIGHKCSEVKAGAAFMKADPEVMISAGCEQECGKQTLNYVRYECRTDNLICICRPP